jgi:phage FluMu gp28-like protein
MEKSRQIGATFTDSLDSVIKAARSNARLDVWVSTRDEKQARLYLEDCAKWANVLGRRVRASAHVLQFSSGRRIYCLSSNPNALAGKRGHVKLDEFALHQNQRLLYQVAKPVTTWGGQVSVISTHRGAQTVFNEILRDIKERGNPMNWSLHSVPLQTAVDQGLVEKINRKLSGSPSPGGEGGPSARPETRAAFIARLRAECIDEEQWLQEYCCVPADESSAFITFDMITNCEDSELTLMSLDDLCSSLNLNLNPNLSLALPKGGGRGEGEHDVLQPTTPLLLPISRHSALFLGVDVARRHDLCVIDVGEKIGDVVWDRARFEFQGRTFSEIESELFRLLKLPQIKRACIDATGMGMQLAERAEDRFAWKVEPITFTAAVKEELAFGLRADFEDRKLRIVSDDKLRSDLRGIKKEVSLSGNIRFLGESKDGHCDRFWAKALRQHAARYKVQVSAAVG